MIDLPRLRAELATLERLDPAQVQRALRQFERSMESTRRQALRAGLLWHPPPPLGFVPVARVIGPPIYQTTHRSDRGEE